MSIKLIWVQSIESAFGIQESDDKSKSFFTKEKIVSEGISMREQFDFEIWINCTIL